MPVLSYTYGQATLTPSAVGGAALVSVSNTATLAPARNAAVVAAVALAVPYPSDALYPSDSLFPDGNYAPAGLNEATVSAVTPALPSGTVTVPEGTTTVINGRTYRAETPNRAWSAIRDTYTETFTVYPGDKWALDSSAVERSELADYATGDLAPFDTDVWLSMWQKVTAPLIDSPWLVAGQFRAWEDAADYRSRSPVFAQEVYGLAGGAVRFQVVTRSGIDDPSTGNYPSVVRYQDDAFQLGRWYRCVYRLQFSRSGGGQLQAWRDGVEVIPASSVPIGYNDALGPNFKFGAYRGAGATQPVTVKYAHVEVGTASLAARVTSPLALPDGA